MKSPNKRSVQQNPLLEAASPYMDIGELAERLVSRPLSGLNIKRLDAKARLALLRTQAEQHYCPTPPHLEIAESIQEMFWHGLERRNPLRIEEQRRLHFISLAGDPKDLAMQALDAPVGGAIVDGITGMGKSASIRRALEVLAPEQVIVHGKSEACGWSKLTQIAYLVVGMPARGSMGGLNTAILAAIDRLLGSDYVALLKNHRTVDKGFAYVQKVLSMHRVGVLVMDENQKENLEEGQWSSEYVLFFIHLMNLGVPVLMSGNPAAFQQFLANGQLSRRFSAHGWHSLVPAERGDRWWERDFMTQAMQFNVCNSHPTQQVVLDATFKLCAGVPGIFTTLWQESSRKAITDASAKFKMTLSHVQDAAGSPRLRKLVRMAEQISTGNRSGVYSDVPNASFADGEDRYPPRKVELGDSSRARRSAARKLVNKEMARKRRAADAAKLMAALDEDDLRNRGRQMAIDVGRGKKPR